MCRVQNRKVAFAEICTVQKFAFAEKCAVQICAFCARRFFAHLQICAFVFCACAESFGHVWKCFFTCAHLWRRFAKVCACKISCFSLFDGIFSFWRFFEKSRNLSENAKMSNSVPSVFDVFPKMSEKSSRVPEWYTSGSWANAFDNTGWQKSPEYALIRIAAGAPDLAKSPNPPPDGPGRPRKSRHFSLRTEKLPDSAPGLAFAPQAEILSGAVFPDPRTTRPSRQTDSEARRVLRQSPTHSANVRTLRKTLAENRRQGQRHSCTPCTPCTTETHRAQTVHTETQPCTLVHNRATSSRHKWQRTHRPCVALVGKGGRCGASTSNKNIWNLTFLYLFLLFLNLCLCYSRYAKR